MKSVVNVVPAIIEDVRVFARRLPERSDVGQDASRALPEQAEATLINFVTASTSIGN